MDDNTPQDAVVADGESLHQHHEHQGSNGEVSNGLHLADDDLGRALRAASEAPERDELWDKVEELAADGQRPDEVAALHWYLLKKGVAPALASHLGERAARFHDEWFEDPAPLARVLGRVLELDPSAEWAFHRLSLLFTKTERWSDLLALYDSALERTKEKARRIELLDEAAHVAKDFAGQADRAILYLEQLFPLKPSDAQLATSLERLFERQGRYGDLIKLWTARVAVLPRDAVQATRARIAACWLDHLNNPAEALAAIEQLLADAGGDTAACGLLERIVALGTAVADVRRRALALLKARYAAADRSADIVRILGVALDFAVGDERIAVHREIANRLIAQHRDPEAVEHAAALLVLEPASDASRTRLRELAERTGTHARYADALAAAADAAADDARRTALLVEAAQVRCDTLGDEPGAIAVYARVLATAGADADVLLGAARRSSVLLERAERWPEQLDVLERLASLEPEGDERRTALGRAARLADRLGEADRALAAWRQRLADEATDVEALDAMVDLLERVRRWEPLIDALRRRAAGTAPDAQRRADLVRIARIYADELRSIPSAIETWTEVQKAFGPNAETVDALADLFTAGSQWTELSTLLAEAATREESATRKAQLLQRLGDVHRAHLGEPAQATARYVQALVADPRNEGARRGLHALLAEPECVAVAVEALASAYGTTDEWALTLEILEPRLAAAPGDADRTLILLEAATIQEQRASDLPAALVAVRRAFPYAADDTTIEQETLRLAEATGEWAVAVEGYRDAIAAATEAPARVMALQVQQGAILETRLADLPAALAVYARVIAAHPDHREATAAVVRVAARIGRWESVASALVEHARAREATSTDLFASIEAIASETPAWDAATDAVGAALAAERRLPPAVARELETQLALWHRDQRNDVDAAEAALLRAVAHDGSDPQTLRMLAALQRRAPGRPLVDTLLGLADATGSDPEALHEAAEVALDQLSDRALAQPILARLLDVAAVRWREGTVAEDESARAPEYHASWVLEHLVQIHLDAGTFARAVDLLADGSRLPFEPETSRSMRRRAAEIATDRLNDGPRAIDLYRGILEETPEDGGAIGRLAALYETHKRLEDLLALRRHELGFAPEAARRLELRLDVARVLGVLGDRAGRIEALRANLEERPGHEASVRELGAILEESGDHGELADVLADQATRLQDAGESSHAAALWARVADIAEQRLSDVERALECYRRVVALGATVTSLDALARLHTARGEHAAAVGWLEQRLELSAPEDRAATVVRLARAHVGAGRQDRAVTVLETALAEDPAAGGVRTLLAELYRTGGAWEPLARLLTDGCQYVAEAPAQLAYLREAAEIYHRRLDAPDAAIPILERAAGLAPTDRSVRTALADALRAAGRLDEARALLEALVEEFGRRRPPERAAVHYQLAQIARAREDLKEALAQLDLAAAMDVNHAGILRMQGDLARVTGQFERAERAYRSLLLIVRRQQPSASADVAIGPSEVLFDLYLIAKQLGQADRAREILESGFETASQSDAEARRFERAIRAAGDHELLLRSLQVHLERATEPAVQAEILNDLAEVYTGLGRAEDALDARLRALAGNPGAAALHEGARALALQAGAIDRYAAGVDALATRATEAGESALASELLLRLGGVVESDLRDLVRARDTYLRAEATGEGRVAAWRALDRVCGALGDPAGQARVLRELVSTGVGEVPGEERTDAYYRLAELELAAPETRAAGAETLASALDLDPQYERAAALLRRAASAGADDAQAVALYERVARASGDLNLLLDALERYAALPDVTAEVLREAVDVATRLEARERAEALLTRAVDIARDGLGGLADAVWALVALAERRKEADDLPGAIRWLRQASDVAEPQEALQLGLEVAALAAGPVGDLPLAAEVYEKLRERDPSDRAIWEPLLDIYRTLGEREHLERVIASTLDCVYDTHERNRLRMERAKILLAEAARHEDAVVALREILDDDPADLDAGTALVDLLERTGREDDLAELLARQLDSARDRQDTPQVVALSLRLGGLLQKTRRQDAIEVYRSALDWAAEDRALLQALLAVYTPDDDAAHRADATERLLALETGPAAAALARDLATLREAAGDEDGVARALDLGFRAHPADGALRSRLTQWYTDRAEYAPLAAMLEFDAGTRVNPAEAVALYRQAAALHREQLNNGAAALAAMRAARALLPEDPALLADYVRSLSAAGEHRAAVDELTTALDHGGATPEHHAELLRLRAEVHLAEGAGASALADLERAAGNGGAAALPELAGGLERVRVLAVDRAEWDLARSATLRLVEVLGQLADTDRARDLLTDWAEREPNDAAALRLLAEMNTRAERWDAAAETFRRLVDLETGAGQLDAALRLADVCERAGRYADAREGLEVAYAAMPASEPLRAHLRKLYETAGAFHELAELCLADAANSSDEATRFERLKRAGELWLVSVGDYEAAIGALERALKSRPNDHDVVTMLADAYVGSARIPEATTLLEAAIALHKGRRSRELSMLQHRMARAAAAAGDRNVEMAWLNVALDSDMQNGHVASELAELAFEFGQTEIALKALRAVTLMKNPGPMSRAMAFLRQGMIAQQQGDPRKAIFLAKKSLAEDPALSDASAFLRELGE